VGGEIFDMPPPPDKEPWVRELRAIVIAVVACLAFAAPVGAQTRPVQPSTPPSEDRPTVEAQTAEREHFQIKVGPSYDEGDFGTSQKTRTFFFPFTLRYLGERWDLGVTTSFVRLDAPGNVVVVDGQPQKTQGASTAREINSGFGDMVFKGRYYLVDDPGPTSWIPTLAPFAKLKAPTADEKKGLGTGEVDWGFGVEWDKSFGAFFIYGDASYTIMGSPPGQDFRNRPGASIGAGYRVTPAITVSTLLDWRRAIASGADPMELNGMVTFRVSRTISVTPNVFVGLSNGSPDWGAGVELSWKFGRW